MLCVSMTPAKVYPHLFNDPPTQLCDVHPERITTRILHTYANAQCVLAGEEYYR